MFLSNLGLEEKGIDLKEQLRIGIFALPIYIFCFSVIDLELVTNNLLDHSLLYIFTLSKTVLEHGQSNDKFWQPNPGYNIITLCPPKKLHINKPKMAYSRDLPKMA